MLRHLLITIVILPTIMIIWWVVQQYWKKLFLNTTNADALENRKECDSCEIASVCNIENKCLIHKN